MMHSAYLRIRLSRTIRITLSVRGVERAMAAGRLPRGQAMLEDLGIWVPVEQHPLVVGLARKSVPPTPTVELPGPLPPEPDGVEPELAEVVLVSPEQVANTEEYARFLASSEADASRRRDSRPSVPVRNSVPVRVIVAGATGEEDTPMSAWRRHVRGIQRWAAAL